MTRKMRHYERVKAYVAEAEERLANLQQTVRGLRMLRASTDQRSAMQQQACVTADALLVMRQQLRMLEDELFGDLHRLGQSK